MHAYFNLLWSKHFIHPTCWAKISLYIALLTWLKWNKFHSISIYNQTKYFFMEIINTFATDEDGYAVETFCNTLFKCISIYIYILFWMLHWEPNPNFNRMDASTTGIQETENAHYQVNEHNMFTFFHWSHN